jgi:ATP-dependent 26S proteasome regulatory subunit
LILVWRSQIYGIFLPINREWVKSIHFKYSAYIDLKVARCTKIIQAGEGEDAKYLINVKQIAKFVVGLGQRVAPTDIEEGMRVGVDRTKYQIQIPLPPKIDPSVTMMQVEEKPDVTYGDVGGCKEQIEKLREVVEMPLLQVIFCLISSQRNLLPWELTLQKEFCFMDHQVNYL